MGNQERKRREKQLRQDDILDAAEKLFFSRGINLTTMDDVARAAEYSKRTVYCYFASKEQMVYAVVLRALKILNTRVRSVAESARAKALQKIRRLCVAFLEFAAAYPDYFKMISFYGQWEMRISRRDPFQEACLAEGRRMFDLLVRTLRQGQEDRSLRPLGDVIGTAYMVYAHLLGTANILLNRGKYSEAIYHKSARALTAAMQAFIVQALRGRA